MCGRRSAAKFNRPLYLAFGCTVVSSFCNMTLDVVALKNHNRQCLNQATLVLYFHIREQKAIQKIRIIEMLRTEQAASPTAQDN